MTPFSYFRYMAKGGTVYIITNKHKTTLYTGVTADLVSRIIEHKEKFYPNSFSAIYNLHVLVYYENYGSITEAIVREKYIKGKSIYKVAFPVRM